MKKNILPTLLIILGILFAYLMLASPGVTPLPFLALALAIGFLGSGIVLIIANQKYPLRPLCKRNYSHKIKEPQPHTEYHQPHTEYMEQFVSERKRRGWQNR